jgi:hypothetical protein
MLMLTLRRFPRQLLIARTRRRLGRLDRPTIEGTPNASDPTARTFNEEENEVRGTGEEEEAAVPTVYAMHESAPRIDVARPRRALGSPTLRHRLCPYALACALQSLCTV